MADETDLKDAPSRDEVEVSLGPDPAQNKVELDLDDAPFLQEPKEASPAVAEGESAPAMPDEAGAKAGKKKKLLTLAGAAVVLLLILGAAVWWFFLRTPPPSDVIEPEVIVVPTPSVETPQNDYVKELAPFLVPRNDNGKMSFLVCKFSALSKSPQVGSEMDQKMISLRDAMYYYLRSKSDAYLMDPANAPTIKQDLTAVLNDYLTQGRVEDVLFESYLNE